MSKIDEQAEAKAGGFQIIVKLGTMFVGELLDGLDFQNDFVQEDEIGYVLALEGTSFVIQCESRISCRNQSSDISFFRSRVCIGRRFSNS